jgi:Ca2+-binding EF-hand superfamily protein
MGGQTSAACNQIFFWAQIIIDRAPKKTEIPVPT